MKTSTVFSLVMLAGLLPRMVKAQDLVDTSSTGVFDSDESLLSSLMSDDHMIDENTPEVRFYGFADFSVSKAIYPKDSGWQFAFNENTNFFVGNLNLYVDADLTHGFSSMAEVRFLFLPSGSNNPDAPGLLDPTVNSRIGGVPDYADAGRPISWGAILIERAYLEYTLHSLARVRVGRYLTPWGIWNVDHGSPVIVGVNAPYIVGEGFFPEAQTGIELFGSYGFGDTSFGYHLTLSNGRGPIEQYGDLDANKALGGRLWLSGRWLGEFTLGFSTYYGTVTDERLQLDLTDPTSPPQTFVFERFEELSFAADLRFEYGPFLVQIEAALRDRVWEDDARPADPFGFVLSDQRSFGAYALLAYRLPWFNLRPFAHVEYYNVGRSALLGTRDVVAFSGGLNIRVIAGVILKAQFIHADFLNPRPGSLAETDFQFFSAQVSWAF